MRKIGVITVAAGVAKNNNDTAVPFALDRTMAEVWLQSDTDGVQFGFGLASTFHADATAAFIPAANIAQGPFQLGGGVPTISVFNPTAGGCNVTVYAR